MSGHSHDASGHVLVTPRDCDASVMMLRAGHGLDTVGNDFSCLEREAHA